jgi:hypothetical protein
MERALFPDIRITTVTQRCGSLDATLQRNKAGIRGRNARPPLSDIDRTLSFYRDQLAFRSDGNRLAFGEPSIS